MRSDKGQSNWDQHLEKLKERWIEFCNGIVRSTIEEEMKLRRMELDARAGTDNQVGEPQGVLEQ